MEAHTHSLLKLFQDNGKYLVPLYQRPYVWEREKHWEPLWDDTLAMAEQAASSNDAGLNGTSPHFLGAIVLEQQTVSTGEIQQRYVIDGQQRLTTLQLLFAAAAVVADAAGCDKEARLIRKMIENDPDVVSNQDDRYKLVPTNRDRAAFLDAMAGRLNTSGDAISTAYRYFREAIGEWASSDGNAEPKLASLASALRNFFGIVAIDLDHRDNAQVIFETLNARGTPLLAIDLVKNLVFDRMQGDGIDLDRMYHDAWQQFDSDYWREEIRQGRLIRPRAELFLMHWLTMTTGQEVPATDLYPYFRKLLASKSRADVVTLVEEFAQDARLFASFDADASPQFFQRLRLLDTSTVLPLVLFLYKHSPGLISVTDRDHALAMLESWLVRRMLCHLTTKNYNRFFLTLLSKVKSEPENTRSLVRHELSESQADTALWPADAKLAEIVPTRPMYSSYIRGDRLIMVLSAVERELRSIKSESDAIGDKLTLEHVMPQKWQQHWPIDHTLAANREEHINRLGNLTIVNGRLNPSLSNQAWPQKREALNAHSVLLMNRQLVDAHPLEWQETDIDKRGMELAKYICRIWPGPDSATWQ